MDPAVTMHQSGSRMEEDGDGKDDSKRKTRNLSEKKRRDQFNILVSELGTMVSTTNRKMDKSTVLKATIAFLKNHNELTVRSRAYDVQCEWKPRFLSNEQFSYLMLEALEGFFMVFALSGRLHYASESVASLLGHNPVELVNQNIFDLAHDDDRPQLYALLHSMSPLHAAPNKGNDMRFRCHLRRGALDLQNEPTYELVEFVGHFRTNMESTDNATVTGYEQDAESRVLFACAGRLQTPHLTRDVTLTDPARNEFTSRQSLEWKFLFLDHRAPPIIGYLPFEVLGTSGYDYCHYDDLDKVVESHEELMQKGELTSPCYRFLTKGQQWIWLQSRYYISYHQWSSKPEFVVCSHRVVSYDPSTDTVKTEETDTETAMEASGSQVAASAPLPMEETPMQPLSPSCMSEASDGFATYQRHSQPASVRSMSVGSTAGTVATAATAASGPSWDYRPRYGRQPGPGSDAGSVSGGSRASRTCHSERGVRAEEAPPLAPQHGMGAQYLDPVPFVAMHGMLPVTLPALLLPEQQTNYIIDEQLNRKHEELQEMIVRQQAELQQVKEQLLLARLGILPPINVPAQYMATEEMPPLGHMQPQMMYAQPQQHPALEYPAHPPYPQMPQ